MEVKDNFVHKVLDVAALRPTHKDGPVMGVAIIGHAVQQLG